jgi:hypothetical protein
MRHFLAIGLTFALFFLGTIAISHVPRGLTAHEDVGIERAVNMTSGKSFDSNAVEIDGIRFETVMPKRILPIPAMQPDATTPVEFGIRITNNTPTPRRFLLFLLLPTFLGTDEQVIPPEGPAVNKTNVPQEFDFPLAMPGESLTFFLKGRFFWVNSELWFVVYVKDGGAWSFRNFKPGTNQVLFTYKNSSSVWNIYDGRLLSAVIEDVWTGVVSTPLVEFCLVHK